MPTARTPQHKRNAGSPDTTSEPLDDDCKRLLAAILDFTSLQRQQPTNEQPTSPLGIGRAIQQHGLAARHTSALLTVALYGPMTVTQLADRERIKLKTASLTAVELEQAGLLERREDPTDRRRTILQIPKNKQRAVTQGLINRAAPLNRALARLTPPQRDGLITGLETLTQEMARDHDI